MKYRSDIDVLRTFAVFPVILFHLGFSQRGYLGVDVFFVISGYLMTVIYKNSNAINFYKKYDAEISSAWLNGNFTKHQIDMLCSKS